MDPFNAPTTIDEAREVVARQRSECLQGPDPVATTTPPVQAALPSRPRDIDGLVSAFSPSVQYPAKGQHKSGRTLAGPVTDATNKDRVFPVFTDSQFRRFGKDFKSVCEDANKERRAVIAQTFLSLAQKGKSIESNEGLRSHQRSLVSNVADHMERAFAEVAKYLQHNPAATETELLIFFDQVRFMSVEWSVASGKAAGQFLLLYSNLGHHREALVNEYLSQWPWAMSLLRTDDKCAILAKEKCLVFEACKEGVHPDYASPDPAAKGLKNVNETVACARVGILPPDVKTFASHTYRLEKTDQAAMANAWNFAGCVNKCASEFADGNLHDGMFNLMVLDEAHRFTSPGDRDKIDPKTANHARIYNQSRTSFVVLLTGTSRGWVRDGFKSIHQDELHIPIHVVSRVTYGHNYSLGLVTNANYLPQKISTPCEVVIPNEDGTTVSSWINPSEPMTNEIAHGVRCSPFVQQQHIFSSLSLLIELRKTRGTHEKILGFSPGPLKQSSDEVDPNAAAPAASGSASVPGMMTDNDAELFPKQLHDITVKLIQDHPDKFTCPIMKRPLRVGYVSSGKGKDKKPVQTDSERALILSQYRDGQIDVLYNYRICSEGFSEETIGIVLNFERFSPDSDQAFNRFIQSAVGRGSRCYSLDDPRIRRIAKRDGWWNGLADYVPALRLENKPQVHYIIDASYCPNRENEVILKNWAREEGASDAIIPPANDNVARFLAKTNTQYQSIIAATLSANAARAAAAAASGSAGPTAVPSQASATGAATKSKEELEKEAVERAETARTRNAARNKKQKEEFQRKAKAMEVIDDFGSFDSGTTTLTPIISSSGMKMIRVSHDAIVPSNIQIKTTYQAYGVFCNDDTSVLAIADHLWFEMDTIDFHATRDRISFNLEFKTDARMFNYVFVRATNSIVGGDGNDPVYFQDTPKMQLAADVDDKFASLLAPKPAKPTKTAKPASPPAHAAACAGSDDSDDSDDDSMPADAPVPAPPRKARFSTAVPSFSAPSSSAARPAKPSDVEVDDSDSESEAVEMEADKQADKQADTEAPDAGASRKRKPAEDRPVEEVSGSRRAKKAAIVSIDSISPLDREQHKALMYSDSEEEEEDDVDEGEDSEEEYEDEDDDDDDMEEDNEAADDEEVEDDEEFNEPDSDYEDGGADKCVGGDDDGDDDDDDDDGDDDEDQDDGASKKKKRKSKPTRLLKVVGYYQISSEEAAKLAQAPRMSADVLEKSMSSLPLTASVMQLETGVSGNLKVSHDRDIDVFDNSKMPKPNASSKSVNIQPNNAVPASSGPANTGPAHVKTVRTKLDVEQYVPGYTACLDKFHKAIVENAKNSSLAALRPEEAQRKATDACTRLTMGVSSVVSTILSQGGVFTMTFDDILRIPDNKLVEYVSRYHVGKVTGSQTNVYSDITGAFTKYNDLMATSA